MAVRYLCDLCYMNGDERKAVAHYWDTEGHVWLVCSKCLKVVKEAGLKFQLLFSGTAAAPIREELLGEPGLVRLTVAGYTQRIALETGQAGPVSLEVTDPEPDGVCWDPSVSWWRCGCGLLLEGGPPKAGDIRACKCGCTYLFDHYVVPPRGHGSMAKHTVLEPRLVQQQLPGIDAPVQEGLAKENDGE